MPIRVLPPDVAARIAAGEVVERPASVVKELLENALDAGASRIAVEVSGGGIDSIRVSDDGGGIEPAQLELAFARHATSKLGDNPDLSRITTLGFRGEALPSIAAVAEVEIVSRPPGAQAAAYARLSDDRPLEQGSRGAPAGTTVGVRALFARLPARRKFLRSPASEANAIAQVVSQYALAYPEVRFDLQVDSRRSLVSSGSGDLRDAAAAVYGAEVAASLLPVRSGDGPLVIEGLAGPPHLSRASRGYVSLFVNRRWVQNRRLAYAVEEAYQGLLMTGRRPIAILNLRLPPNEVDVNVHPTKAEVRFRDESALFGAVQRSVRAALLAAAPVPALSGVEGPSTEPVPALSLATQPSAPPLWEHARRLETAPAGAQPPAATPAVALPVLRVIGQFGGIYIVAEGPDGMYLIDQHAAHERVLYERFCRLRRSRAPEVQALLEPLALDLTSRQRAVLSEQDEALREHGFALEPFGDGAYLLRALPSALAAGDLRQSVAEFLDLMLEEEGGDPATSSGRDPVAMSLACHGAVRAGKTLTSDEMRELVRLLEESEAPNTCPHGRPTMVQLSVEALARQFGRR